MQNVDKNIPIPVDRRRFNRGRPIKYPWRTLELGESFEIATGLKTAQSYASTFGKKIGRKFTARAMDDGSIRVWRLE